MTLALVGSRALILRLPYMAAKRKVADFDFISTLGALDAWRASSARDLGRIGTTYWKANKFIIRADLPVEFEVALDSGGTTRELLEFIGTDSETTHNSVSHARFGCLPSIDILFLLKSSHRYAKDSPHFWKTLGDYHVLKAAGARVRPEWRDWLYRREKETYDYKPPSLARSKDDFFSGDGIDYVWDHDSIHEVVALDRKPAYTQFLDGQVRVSKPKFDSLPHAVKIASVVEESCVLAIERSLVPHPGVLTPVQAWRLALSKVLSSITSGWWREWAYDHALEVLAAYPEDYWNQFQRAVSAGSVRAAK